MHQRTALGTREYRFINRCCPSFARKNHTAARTTKRFVCCCCYEMCVRHWVRVQASCNKTSDMRHIDEEECAYIVRNRCHCFEIDCTRVSTCASNQHARLVFESCFTNFV